MLRSAIAAMAFAGLALPAFASYTFETVEPVSKKRVIAESVVWTCEDTVCTGDLKRKAPTVRVCKKIAKEVGTVSAFRNTASELSAEELAECNTAAKK
ncbi:MAG: CC_3452 family protein [Hyphomonas sp.]